MSIRPSSSTISCGLQGDTLDHCRTKYGRCICPQIGNRKMAIAQYWRTAITVYWSTAIALYGRTAIALYPQTAGLPSGLPGEANNWLLPHAYPTICITPNLSEGSSEPKKLGSGGGFSGSDILTAKPWPHARQAGMGPQFCQFARFNSGRRPVGAVRPWVGFNCCNNSCISLRLAACCEYKLLVSPGSWAKS